MKLKYKANKFISYHRQFVAAQARKQSIAQIQLPFVIGIHRTQNVQQSTLAATRLPHDRYKLSLVHTYIDALQDLNFYRVNKRFPHIYRAQNVIFI
jgi:uncharacterized protein (DUF952 family)